MISALICFYGAHVSVRGTSEDTPDRETPKTIL